MFAIWHKDYHAKTDLLLDNLATASTNYQGLLSEIAERNPNDVETRRLSEIIAKHEHAPTNPPAKAKMMHHKKHHMAKKADADAKADKAEAKEAKESPKAEAKEAKGAMAAKPAMPAKK